MSQRISRREFCARRGRRRRCFPLPRSRKRAARVVVVGGGFGGASCARALKRSSRSRSRWSKRAAPSRPARSATACSPACAIGRSNSATTRSRRRHHVVSQAATAVDPQARTVGLADGTRSPTTGWCWRPASICAATRCPATTKRRREDAACLEGRRADAAAAPPARGHGGRRRGRHLRAGQSVPLSARPLRARQPDRALPQDQEAALETDRARRQGHLLQAAAVPGGVEGALSRRARMGRCRRAARSTRSMWRP